jgi:hypothetical protein
VSIPGAQWSCVSLRANWFCVAGERGSAGGSRSLYIGEMPRAGAVYNSSFVFDLDHPSRWKSCCERPTPLKYSRLCMFRKGNADYEEA